MKYFSTTALAKHLNLEPKALFGKLIEVNYIVRSEDVSGERKNSEKWVLTAKGKLAGGIIKTSEKLGNYIQWPEGFNLEKLPEHHTPDKPIEMTTSTKIGKELGVPAIKLNYIFSELGWINKSLKGWVATEQGLKQGAEQSEDSRTGVPYVKWPASIIESKHMLASIQAVTGTDSAENTSCDHKYKSTDGHFVRSKAEMLIDNWLYMAEIVHAYQRKLPIEEDVHCAFYIPTGKVYIEYWGISGDPKYLARKEKKQGIYQKYGFKLIELNDKDVLNLDDILPRLLLKFSVQAY